MFFNRLPEENGSINYKTQNIKQRIFLSLFNHLSLQMTYMLLPIRY